MKREIGTHWEHVAERTGHPFDFAFFERDGFVYDTEPADRAAVVAALLNPRLALSYFTSIQRAFYAENRDVTDAATLAGLAADHGMDAVQFSAALASEEARRATMRDFEIARSSGVTGFPTVFAGDPQSGYALVTSGYRPLDGLTDILEDWLAQA